MGVVYVAEHVSMGRRACVKVLKPEYTQDEEIVARFFNEARAAASIQHPGIVDIFDFGTHDDGHAYIVMELLPGESLASRLERVGTLAPPDALRLVRQTAGALAAAHDKHIVHRDLKPDNIFLSPDPEVPGGERVKLLDFGIAKLVDKGMADSVRTRTGAVIGTPTYMSPEQCEGAGEVDHRSDIYSLACIYYELLTGRPPFVHRGAGRIIAAHIHEQPRSARALDPSVPAAVDTFVMRCLAKRRDDRPGSMREVLRALDALGDESGPLELAVTPPGPRPTPAPPGGGVLATTVPPAGRSTPTTLRSTTGEVRGGGTAAAPRARWLPLAGAGAAAVVAVVAIGMQVLGDDDPVAEANADGVAACRDGDGAACIAVARDYERGPAAERDKALVYYGLGCDAAAGEACGVLAQMYETGRSVARSDRRALEFRRSGCSAQHGPSCLVLGDRYASGDGVVQNPNLSMSYWERACGGGAALGCRRAAAREMDAVLAGKADRAAAAVRLYGDGCDGGDAESCATLSQMYYFEVGVAQDKARSIALARRACSLSGGALCADLGRAYLHGEGVPRDAARGLELLTGSCEADSGDACLSLGVAYQVGTGGTRDVARAVQLVTKACALDFDRGCKHLGDMYARGDGVTVDAARAASLYARACELGMNEACAEAD